MRRTLRRKIIIQQIDKKLETFDRRIQQMAENAYKLRQFRQTLINQENDNAIRETGSEGSASSGSADRDAGQSDVLDPTTIAPVLEEQPAELSSNSGDSGIVAGSAI